MNSCEEQWTSRIQEKSSTPVLLSVYIIYVTATAFMCFANKHIIIIIIISPLEATLDSIKTNLP